MLSSNSSVDWIDCGYNWTGPVYGTTAFGSTTSDVAGYVACLIAVLCYGSNFVFFKFVNTADGFFTQWVMCASIWLVGLIIQLMREQPIFFPWTVLGGTLWTIGNCCAIPIINLIGLSIGILIWNTTNVLVGWATGRFGLFACPEVPSNEALNYAGVVLSLLAGAVYIFVKTETRVDLPDCLKRRFENPSSTTTENSEREVVNEPSPAHFINDDSFVGGGQEGDIVAVGAVPSHPENDPIVESTEGGNENSDIFLGNLSPMSRRILGIVLSLVSGCFYGVQFLPATYTQNHVIINGIRASQDGLDYCFSTFCGIFMASTTAFIGYMIINRKSPVVSPQVVLPGVCSGVLWAIATGCFFLANSTLSQAISFPIIATAPGMIAALWGIFLFREIRGRRNFLILALAFSLNVAGALMTAFSK